MGLFKNLKSVLGGKKMNEVSRYQNMMQSDDLERALKRYHTDKDSLDADSVHFQSIDDMDMGEKYLVSYFMPTIVPISEILWIQFVDTLNRKYIGTFVSDGYLQLLRIIDENNFDTIVKMLLDRNKELIYGDNPELKELFKNDFEQFQALIALHPHENAANIQVDPALLEKAKRKKAEAKKNAAASEKADAQNAIRKALPDGFMVTDKESARAFFMACEVNRQTMKEVFSQEVYDAFQGITDYQMLREFTKEFALKKFQSILTGEADDIPSIAYQVCQVSRSWGMDFYDDEFIESLIAVSKLSNQKSPNVKWGEKGYPIQFRHDTWLLQFLEKYNNRGKEVLKVKPLVEMTSDYLTKKYPQNHEHQIAETLKMCSTLKGLITEATSQSESLGMKFALANENEIDRILDEFSAICNDHAGKIKGMIYSLNCVYGIRTPEFYITAASDTVDAGSNRSWDTFKFAAVFYHENTAAFFECIRHEDGFFYPEKRFREKYPVLVQYQDKIAQAIAFYRNRDASEKFRKHLENENPEFSYYNAMADKRKTLCERFGDSFAYLRERIHGQSIGDTLTELLDCCEAVAPMIGVEQTSFNAPAAEQEIAECEGRIGFALPVQMKEFLQFSNGASLFENSTTIWDTATIGKYTLDGYDDENAKTYLPIGDFIGDGTQFVLNKETGDVAEWDHETGEVMEYGDFEAFLGAIMDFHCSDYID